jgi:hypothetical protein
MVMISPLSYGLASYSGPITRAEATVPASCTSACDLMDTLPQLIANNTPHRRGRPGSGYSD